MKGLQELDKEVFPELGEEHYGHIDDWERKWTKLPDAGRLLVTQSGEIAGYWSFAPLTSEQQKQFASGNFFDIDMSADILPTILPGNTYCIYFSAIVVRGPYRTGGALLKLLRSLRNCLKDISLKGATIDKMYANAFSEEGKRICELYGGEKIVEHCDQGSIYCLTYNAFEMS